EVARDRDPPRDRPAVDLNPPLALRAVDDEPGGPDLLAEGREVADVEIGLGEKIAEPGLGETRPRRIARPRAHEGRPRVEVELRHVAVDAEPALGAGHRQRTAERERTGLELEAVVSGRHRQDEAASGSDVPLHV